MQRQDSLDDKDIPLTHAQRAAPGCPAKRRALSGGRVQFGAQPHGEHEIDVPDVTTTVTFVSV